jgi:predicted O-methyltransferase YrrM
MRQTDVDHEVDYYKDSFVSGRTGKRIATSSASSRNNIHVLSSIMDRLRPKRTLEVGLALGVSALALAGKHRDAGAMPAGQHVAIDPYQSSVWDDCGVIAIEAAGLSAYCNVIRDFSSQALPRLVEKAEEFDLL